jgi:hypothetical protein
MEFKFWKASGIPPGLQPFLASYLDQPPPGTCTVMGTRSSADLLFDRLQLTPLDAGTRFSIVGPRGSDTITTSGGRATSVLNGRGGVAAPGDYILRVEGNDSTGSGGGGFQCCWSNAHVSVTVK